MSTVNRDVTDLPQYLNYDDAATERRYQELFNLILTGWFNSNGFFLPALSNTEVTSIMALTPTPVQRIWINSNTNKIQFLDTAGALHVVTSV